MYSECADILIADAGGTKTDWAFISRKGGSLVCFRTAGINAVHSSDAAIREALQSAKDHVVAEADNLKIRFFGAGCANEKTCRRISSSVLSLWENAQIKVQSDLTGAAISLLGDSDGIACILGTGSNSGKWENRRIVRNTPPLGYILGDEGGGASLGKRLLNAIYKRRLSDEMIRIFESETKLSLSEIIEKVYRSDRPAQFLASLAPFLKKHLGREEIFKLVSDEFIDFFSRNVSGYEGISGLTVSLTGSIAWHFRDVVGYAARKSGLTLGEITETPMPGLINYFKTKCK